VATLNKHSTPGAAVSPILPPQDGYMSQDKAKFPASFAADVDAEKAAFWGDSQVPWGVAASSGTIGEPAWRTKPSWYLIATDDRMIPPEDQRAMAKRAGATVVEVKASHAVYISQPSAVAALIEQADRDSEGCCLAGPEEYTLEGLEWESEFHTSDRAIRKLVLTDAIRRGC
jgi:pimeloyl-ACP methyl ester carboxylesterase